MAVVDTGVSDTKGSTLKAMKINGTPYAEIGLLEVIDKKIVNAVYWPMAETIKLAEKLREMI